MGVGSVGRKECLSVSRSMGIDTTNPCRACPAGICYLFRRAGPHLHPVCRADPVTAVPWAAVPVAA